MARSAGPAADAAPREPGSGQVGVDNLDFYAKLRPDLIEHLKNAWRQHHFVKKGIETWPNGLGIRREPVLVQSHRQRAEINQPLKRPLSSVLCREAQ